MSHRRAQRLHRTLCCSACMRRAPSHHHTSSLCHSVSFRSRTLDLRSAALLRWRVACVTHVIAPFVRSRSLSHCIRCRSYRSVCPPLRPVGLSVCPLFCVALRCLCLLLCFVARALLRRRIDPNRSESPTDSTAAHPNPNPQNARLRTRSIESTRCCRGAIRFASLPLRSL